MSKSKHYQDLFNYGHKLGKTFVEEYGLSSMKLYNTVFDYIIEDLELSRTGPLSKHQQAMVGQGFILGIEESI